MISIIQLVKQADVRVADNIVGAIQQGILALVGFEKSDSLREVEKLFKKIVTYRIFPDAEGKTNLSLVDVQGGLLLVPQFTLVAETSKGSRPSFSSGMAPLEGKELFDELVAYAKDNYPHTECGVFGAYMQVSLCNDGPMTFYFKV
ncbi:MAG: D-tyrosyl-tRNA(Tyr) deacylase [Legionella sp.]|nr:MAG: D-tyrosyl-tRNA(Tyr) deacylase [Legionella sp.]